MRVLMTGSSGFLGGALTAALRRHRYETRPLIRVPSDVQPHWDPARGEIAADRLEGFDAVLHLAGENLAAGRWTARRRRLIRDSRVSATRLLCETLARLDSPPKVLIVASAVGYYGSRGEEILDEDSGPGEGFLSGLTADWEAATVMASEAGIRVVNLRLGMVLGQGGGALPRLVPIFLAGLGGRLGSGKQWMSWIALDDLAAAVLFLLEREDLSGPVNLVAPGAVRNAEFTRRLARALGRVAILPAPSFLLRALLGPMAGEVLLASQRVRPARLREAGFVFRDSNLDAALEHLFPKRRETNNER